MTTVLGYCFYYLVVVGDYNPSDAFAARSIGVRLEHSSAIIFIH